MSFRLSESTLLSPTANWPIFRPTHVLVLASDVVDLLGLGPVNHNYLSYGSAAARIVAADSRSDGRDVSGFPTGRNDELLAMKYG